MTTAPDHGGTGPCPVSPCDWDLEGTLDEHLYCDHEAEVLASALVRIALENDGLRVELDKVDHALTASKAAGYQAAARDATDLLMGHGPDAEMIVRFLQDRSAEQAARCSAAIAREIRRQAKPLGKQPEPQAQLAAVLAKASETRWRVYSFDAGDWMPTSSACDTPAEARRKEQQLATRYPGLPTVIVRETRTYQTEEQQ